MSWKRCHGCKGKGFVILKDKDENEIMRECIICDGEGMIFDKQVCPNEWWHYPYGIPYTIDGIYHVPYVQIDSNDTRNWPPDVPIIYY